MYENLVRLKQTFERTYKRKNKFYEIIPFYKSELFPINQNHLDLLHEFVSKNPLYHNSFEKSISGISCIIYEGKLSQYTHKHSESLQPFYPTWLMSAYLSVSFAKELGYSEVIDVGSGDGRVSFCAKLLGLKSYSIELDENLVKLQKQYDLNVYCSNAVTFDYGPLNLSNPVFFIGGLAGLGGGKMALGVLRKINLKRSGWVFIGKEGWMKFIEKHELKHIQTISLPTGWTGRLHENYVFTCNI